MVDLRLSIHLYEHLCLYKDLKSYLNLAFTSSSSVNSNTSLFITILSLLRKRSHKRETIHHLESLTSCALVIIQNLGS